jgi:short-subunit dehydrogenase
VALTHKFIGAMKQRNRGAIVFLSSMAGTMPIPFMSTYSATKAFPLFFVESLYGELAQSNIDVVAVVPGDTSTENCGKCTENKLGHKQAIKCRHNL